VPYETKLLLWAYYRGSPEQFGDDWSTVIERYGYTEYLLFYQYACAINEKIERNADVFNSSKARVITEEFKVF